MFANSRHKSTTGSRSPFQALNSEFVTSHAQYQYKTFCRNAIDVKFFFKDNKNLNKNNGKYSMEHAIVNKLVECCHSNITFEK